VGWEAYDRNPYPGFILDLKFSKPVGKLGDHEISLESGSLYSSASDFEPSADLVQQGWSVSGTLTTESFQRLNNPNPDSADPEHPKVLEQEGNGRFDLVLTSPSGTRYSFTNGTVSFEGVKYYQEWG
jgi:hypothetical protein